MLLKKIALGVYFFFCLGYFCPTLFADTVVLKSGQVVEGKIIENTNKYVKIDFDGVGVTYFQEEVASINQDKTDNLASKELTSLYDTFKSSKDIVENKKLPVESADLAQPIVNQAAQGAVDVNAASLSKIVESINSPETAKAALSQLPKDYQEIIFRFLPGCLQSWMCMTH